MKKWIGLAIVVLLPVAAWAQADKPPTTNSKPPTDLEILGYGLDVHGFLDVTYQSKYVWRGFDIYRNKGAAQMTAGVKFADTGFGAVVSGHLPAGGGNELWQRWDYNLYYQNSLYKGEPIQTDYRLGWVYYNYPRWPWRAWDLQEGHAIVSLPNITAIKGLVPSVMLIKMWPSGSGSPHVGSNASGWMYLGMLDYVFSVPGFIPTIPEQVIKLHGELMFNDGFSPYNTPVDSDWSDAVVGVSTDFDIGYGITVTPGVYYQKTMDQSISTDGDDNEAWFTLGARLNF